MSIILSHLNRYLRPAKTYYVDATNGNDSNPGNSEHSALQTIPTVNALPLLAGDRVLYKCNETFPGKLVPAYAGIPGRYIEFGSYGEGNRPIIDGTADSALVVESPINYLRFDGIDFFGTSVAGAHTVRYYSDNGYFYDCIFRGALGDPYGMGFTAHTDTGAELYNIILEACQAYDNFASGITITSDTGAGGPHDCLIRGCIAHDNGTNQSADHGIYVRHGVVVERCTSYNNISGGFKTNCEGVYTSPYKSTVRNCVSYGNRYGIIVDGIDSVIFNNLLYANTYTALATSTDGDRSLIYFNTFANCTAGNGLLEFISLPNDMEFKNNIFVQDHSIYDKGFLCIYGATLEQLVAANVFDYNLYFHNALGDGHGFFDSENHTFAVWQGLGADTNSTLLVVDPDFVARYTDYHPADAGNLKGMGVAITGYEMDKDGNTRSDPPTQGCFEEAAA